MKFLARKSVLVTAAVLLVGCGPSAKDLQEEANRKAKEMEKAKIEALQSRASSSLKDPVSAQFRNIKLLADGTSICGEINGKNTFGGYVGFRIFAANEAGETYIIKTLSRELMQTLLHLNERDRMSGAFQHYLRIQRTTGEKIDKDGLVMDMVAMSNFKHWKECFEKTN